MWNCVSLRTKNRYNNPFQINKKHCQSTTRLKTEEVGKKFIMGCHIDRFDEYVQEMHSLKYFIRVYLKKITFSHEKTTFQWQKVVSEAIFPTALE